MPVKVKWKTVCLAFLVSVVQLTAGMFVQRHCNHLYPRPDEVMARFVINRFMRRVVVALRPPRFFLYSPPPFEIHLGPA
jgi:hypothetical protein